MDYRRIRHVNDIIGVLEDGDFNAAVTAEHDELLRRLIDLAPPKGKPAKGRLTITLDYEVVGKTIDIVGNVAAKAPKPVRGKSAYWITADNALSTEHPKQTSMFDDSKVRSFDERKGA